MDIIDEFNQLRSSLKPVIEEWKPHLAGISSKIRKISNESERLAFIIELNKFKDTHRMLEALSTETPLVSNPESLSAVSRMTTKEIKENIATLYNIRKALQENEYPYENIGDEIVRTLLEPVENKLVKENKDKLFQRFWCATKLKKTLRLTKDARKLMPPQLYDDIIKRVNACILILNQYTLGSFGKGVLLQHGRQSEKMEDGVEFQYCVGVMFIVRCQQCNTKEEIHTGMYDDVYAPTKCKKCKSHKIVRCNG